MIRRVVTHLRAPAGNLRRDHPQAPARRDTRPSVYTRAITLRPGDFPPRPQRQFVDGPYGLQFSPLRNDIYEATALRNLQNSRTRRLLLFDCRQRLDTISRSHRLREKEKRGKKRMTERSRREKEKEREIRCLLLCSRYSVCVLEQSFQKQYRNN